MDSPSRYVQLADDGRPTTDNHSFLHLHLFVFVRVLFSEEWKYGTEPG